MKKEFKLAGTFNIVIALIAFLKDAAIIYPLILSVLSIIYFTYCEKNITYIYNKKTLIIIFALINFFINPISGITLLIGQDKIISEYKNSDKTEEEKQELSSEERKISLSLNLGVALISLSGIILITTKWNIMNNAIKIIILIVFALLFLGLSILSEKKLKIEMLSKNYWLLSLLFIILTVIANGYFEILSKWFSFNGVGRYLYVAFTSIVISLLSVITDNKYHKTIYKNISYLGIITSIISIMLYFKIDVDMILIILNIALLAINTTKKQQIENIKELSKYVTIGLSIFSIISIPAATSIITNLLLAILTIVNLIIITISVNIEAVSTAIIINITVVETLLNLSTNANLNNKIISIIAMIIYSGLYLINLIKIEKLNQTFKKTMNVLTNISMFLLLIINSNNKMLLTIISAVFAMTSLINYYKDTIKNEKYLLPVKITIFIISSIAYITEIIDINTSYIMIIMYMIIFIVYKLLKNNKAKNISLCIYYIIFTIALFINHNKEIIPSIINLVLASTTFMLISEEKNNKKTIISYIAFLLTIAFAFAYTNILNTTPLYNGIIILLIYLILTIIPIENEKLKKPNYFSIILPLLIMISDVNISSDIKIILTTSIGMYVMMLLNMLLIKNIKDRNIFTTIISTILILRIIFIESWIIGLYIGSIALVLLIIGLMKKDYKGLFTEGIIITIINLLLQFRYILKELPLWIYTLLAGLIIIGIVTYKIIKNNEKNNR